MFKGIYSGHMLIPQLMREACNLCQPVDMECVLGTIAGAMIAAANAEMQPASVIMAQLSYVSAVLLLRG